MSEMERIARELCERMGYNPDDMGNHGPRWQAIIPQILDAVAMRKAVDEVLALEAENDAALTDGGE